VLSRTGYAIEGHAMYRNRDREQFDAIVAGLREDDPRFVRRIERGRRRPSWSWSWAWPIALALLSVVPVVWLGRYGLVVAACAFAASVAALALGLTTGGFHRWRWRSRHRDRPG
jgi:hypothetical protein